MFSSKQELIMFTVFPQGNNDIDVTSGCLASNQPQNVQNMVLSTVFVV